MNNETIPTIAKKAAQMIIDWCVCKDDTRSANMPSELIENLLKTQREITANQAVNWFRQQHDYAEESWLEPKCKELKEYLTNNK